MQASAQSNQLIARAYGQHFHAAIRIIAHPSKDAQHMGLAFYEPAKTHALHASTNDETFGLLDRVIG